METVTIRLLGTPEVCLGDLPQSFRTRKVLALLIYLAVERRTHSRNSLTALLWPKSSAKSAATTLRVTLSRLRKTLQPAGDVLISEAGKVGFKLDSPIDLDLDWLQAGVHAEISPDELRAIMSLDRGEFLEGFSLSDAPAFDTWVSIQREVCQRQLETVYDRLSQHLLAMHDSVAAVDAATRWVERAPLSEQAYRRLMAAQALNGQRPAALRTYQQLRATLAQELGLEPSQETVGLADNISLGHVGIQRRNPPSRAGHVSTTDRQRRLALPLVGRFEEHRHLVESFHRIRRGQAQAVVIIGAAGVGKTRLVNAFRDWASFDSTATEIWQGQAFETGGRLAFQPVVEALRPRLDRVNSPEDLLEDVWLAELSQLMPELRARYPDLPLPLTGDAHFVRGRLFESIAELGNALAMGHPSILILDDIQWADPDTLDLVRYLARRWAERNAPIMMLLTVRQEAYAADNALREWLTSLERDVSISRLLLDSLNGAMVEELVARLAGEASNAAATSAFAVWLWAETRGLPFFIEGLLQMLIEQGVLVAVDDQRPTYDFGSALDYVRSLSHLPLPPGVREVIRARLKQQSKQAGALLLASAVLGRACTFERMCQIADLQEMDALEPLEALLNGRLLAEQPSDRQPYTVAHDYIREVVYTESREARRRVYHRRALLALEATGEPAAECAFHALAALLDEPAFRFSVAAGSEALASYALQDALSHFDAARLAAQRIQSRGELVDTKLLSRLYQQRGQVLELNQDDLTAVANYVEMREEAVIFGDPEMELAALIAQTNIQGRYTGAFNPSKAKESGQEALALAQELGDRAAEASALWGVAVAELYSAGDIKQVMGNGQQALTLARELGLEELMGRILINLCWPLVAQKRLEQARAGLSEAQVIFRELGNLSRLCEASRFMLILHNVVGNYRRALAEAPALIELGIFTGSKQDEIEPMIVIGFAYARQGRFELANESLQKVRIYAETLGYSNEEHGHQWARIKFYLEVGATDAAGRWADRLYAQSQAIVPIFTSIYLTEVARAKIACNKLDEGRAILDGILETLPSDAIWSHNIILIAIAYGELHLALGQPEYLFAGLEERVRPFREAGFGYQLADELWLRGRAELALGHYDAAREFLLQSQEAAEVEEERAILWKILATQSELERVCGNATAAENLRNQARAVVTDIAANAGELREVFLSQPAVVQLISDV